MTEFELRQRRERAARSALASSTLEGLLPSKGLQTSLHNYIEGTTSLEQMLKDAQARHARG